MRTIITLYVFWLVSSVALASSGVTFHGRIIKSIDDTPLLSPTTEFRIRIKSPGAENCLLWEETQTRDMSASAGVFTLTVGQATVPNTTAILNSSTAANFTLPQVFSNGPNYTGLSCGVGTSYASSSLQGRVIEMSFRETTGVGAWEDLPPTTVNYVPLAYRAVESETLGGRSANEFLKIASYPSQTILSNGQVDTLLGLVNGTDTTYLRPADAFAGDVTGPSTATVVARIRGTNVVATAPTINQVLKFDGTNWVPAADDAGAAPGDASYAAKGVIQINTDQTTSGLFIASGVLAMPNVITAAGPVGGVSTIPVITYDQKGRLTVVTTATVDDTTKLPLAGGTMTGPINMGTQNITNATSMAATNFSGRNLVLNDNDTNTATITAPTDIPVNYVLTLPANDGDPGQVLLTDGAGVLTWGVAAAGDITSVVAGAGLITGGTTGDVTLDVGAGTGIIVNANDVAVNVGTGANQIVQLNASSELPAVSGVNLTNLNADNIASGTLAITRGGTGATTANAAINNLLPNQATFAGRVLTTDGTNTSWVAASAGTVTSVSSTNSYLSVATATTTPALTLNVGTAANTVAAGDDARITGAVQQVAYAADLAPAALCTTAQTPYWNTVSDLWACQAISVTSFSGNLAGDVTGAQGTTVVERIRGVNVVATAPTVNQILKFDGTNYVPSADLGLTAETDPGVQAWAKAAPNAIFDTTGDVLNITPRIPSALAAPAVGQDGQTLRWNNGTSQWEWFTPGVAGSGFTQGGNSFTADATLGTNDAYDLNFETSGSTRMTILDTGNVGIGTAAPSTALHVVGDLMVSQSIRPATGSNSILLLNNQIDAGGLKVGAADSINLNFDQDNNGTGALNIRKGTTNPATSTPLMTVINNGNVGIGTTSPGALLDLGTAGTSRGTFRMAGNTSGYVQIQPAAAAGDWTMTLPANDGDPGELLSTDGNGVLSWTAASAGDITSVVAGAGLITGGTTGDVTLDVGAGTGIIVNANDVAVNVGTGANQIVQLNGSSELPAVSGVNLTNLNADNVASGTLAIARGGTGATTANAAINNLLPSQATFAGRVLATDGTNTSWVAASAGTVTSVSSTNSYLSVATATTTPALTLNIGTAANTVAAGDDSRITGAVQQVAYAADLAPAALCTTVQTAYWNTVSDTWACQNINFASGGAFVNSGNSFGAAATLGTNDNFALNFETNNSTRMTILNSGRVGIGTTTPSIGKVMVSTNSAAIDDDEITNISYSNNAAYFSGFVSARSRGTEALPSTVLSGDYLGGFVFYGLDGTQPRNSAGVISVAQSDFNSSVSGSLRLYTVNGANDNVKLFISPIGHVAIGDGIVNPSSILDINGAFTQRGMAAPAVSPAGQGRIYFDSGSNVFRVSQNGGAYANLVGGGGATTLDGLTDVVTNYATTYNMYLGSGVGTTTTSGTNNTGLGAQALENITTAGNTVAIGNQSLQNLTTGSSNVAVGRESLNSTTTGANNTAVGMFSLGYNTTDSDNVAIGSGTLGFATAPENTAVGSGALGAALTGGYNTALGYRSGLKVIGASAGNVFLGFLAGPSSDTTISDSLWIHNDEGIPTIYGDLANRRIGIGTTTTSDKLHVAGDIRVGVSGVNGCLKDFSGGTITGTCSSDIRLKKDFRPMSSVSDKLSQIQPVYYKWRSEEFPDRHYGDDDQLGVMAQEVKKHFPSLVVEDEDGYYQVRYADFTMYLLKGFSEHHQQLQSQAVRTEMSEKQLQSVQRSIASLEEENVKLKMQVQELRDQLKSQADDIQLIKKHINLSAPSK